MQSIQRWYCLLVLAITPTIGWTVIDLQQFTPVPPGEVQVSPGRAFFDRVSGNTSFTVQFTLLGSQPYPGPFYVLVSNLPPGVTLVNAADTAPDGSPVLLIPGDTWSPGETLVTQAIYQIGRNRIVPAYTVYATPDAPPVEITSFTATTPTIVEGQSVDLSWETVNADTVAIEPGVGAVGPDGMVTVTPTETTTYTLTAGNLTSNETRDLTITVQPRLDLAIRANPPAGDAPLTVRFTPLPDTFTAINRYRWDFDGNGSYDRTDTVGRDQTWTYSTPGDYNVALEALASDGTITVATLLVPVGNRPPTVSASVDTSNGEVPLPVRYFASASDSNGIALYEWDFEGDGTFDYSSPSSGNTVFTFTTAGTFQSTVRVTDGLGAPTTLSLPNIEIRAQPPGSPSVVLALSRNSGNAPLSVTLTATPTLPSGQTITAWSWDFDGDGTVDETGGSPQTYIYDRAGQFFPTVEITTDSGGTAKDVRTVNVTGTPTMNGISWQTIDPEAGGEGNIPTQLTAVTRVSLVIEDENNVVVRTLVPFQDRDPGSYTDVWDGRNDTGEIVPAGPNYPVLLYGEPGFEQRVDPRIGAPSRQYNPPRSRIPSTFSPYANDPLDINFTLTRPSEVTAFMGLFRTNTRLITFLQREPLGAGSYTIHWNGEAPNGQTIPNTPGNPYLFGIWGWELAPSVIFVSNNPRIDALTLTPSIFNPTTTTAANDGFSHILFTLNKAVTNLEIVVSDVAAGAEVARVSYGPQAAGAGEVLWDGKNNDGVLLAPGRYRIGLQATDANGSTSMIRYGMQRIYY